MVIFLRFNEKRSGFLRLVYFCSFEFFNKTKKKRSNKITNFKTSEPLQLYNFVPRKSDNEKKYHFFIVRFFILEYKKYFCACNTTYLF